MKTKPKQKTCYSRRVVVYDIASGKRTELSSISKGAAKVGVCVSHFGDVIRSGMVVNGYVCAYIEDEEKAVVKLANCKARGEYVKPKRKRDEELFPLRIDSKTVIYVTKDKANEEYAETWRQRHEADKNHTVGIYEAVDGTKQKKIGGRP